MMQSKGGSVVIGLFIVIAATLLFIPELARFSRGAGDTSSSKAPVEKKKDQRVDEAPEEESEDVPEGEFHKLMDQLEEGDVAIDEVALPQDAAVPQESQLSATEAAEKQLEEVRQQLDKVNMVSPEDQDVLSYVGEPPIPPERQKAREEMRRVLSDKKVSWTAMTDPRVLQPINSAIKEASTLLKVVGRPFPRSRFALLSYINGLKSLLKGKASAPTADFKEMLEYLGVLDVRVTQSFIEERIDRTEYLIWRAISLGAIVEFAGAQNDFLYEAPFRADITITSLDLSVTVNRKKKQREFKVKVVGILESKEASHLEVYQGKRLLRIIDLPKQNFREGQPPLRRWQFDYVDDQGTKPYTFRALDDRGNFLQKSYSLVALPMRRFPNKDGKFEIPGVRTPHLNERPITKLDEMLLISVKGNTKGPKKILNSGDEVMQFSKFDTRIERLKQF